MSYIPGSFLKTDESPAFSDALYGVVAELKALASYKPQITHYKDEKQSYHVRFILNGKGCESLVLGVSHMVENYADDDRVTAVSLQWRDGVGELELSFV
ncbi:TPA: hypothetical protein ACNV18_000844 [Pseudomonas putida]|uniref:hypothetical protein n=1 Tax=Pseudomonas sp. MB-090624 TaxID=2213078 RepID=UPI000D88EF67|nr:hypothetical protein [Pseudomonas sp. MB-090624]PYB99968.1 hypothetical protein DMX12_14260 [Pseudomonas sp. MB-090624]